MKFFSASLLIAAAFLVFVERFYLSKLPGSDWGSPLKWEMYAKDQTLVLFAYVLPCIMVGLALSLLLEKRR